MQIELGFLDHLMGMLSLDGVNGYDTHGSSERSRGSRPHGALHVLDLQRLSAMSIPTLQGLQTALSGLHRRADRRSTSTGNNIANANTEGYSRETAVLETNSAADDPGALARYTGEGAQLGTGVTSTTITRIRNTYLDAQYRTQNSALSARRHAGGSARSRRRRAFNEPSSAGHRQPAVELLDRLEQPRQRARPAKPRSRRVVAAGEQLADDAQRSSAASSRRSPTQVGEQYDALTGPARRSRRATPNQIAQLNGQIKLAEEAGQPPNDMLDRRDLLLDKLSALANVTVTEQPDHTDTVTFGERRQTAGRRHDRQLAAGTDAAAGGELGALLEPDRPRRAR